MPAAVAGTVSEALASASEAIAAAGGETPRLDAELLLAEACATDRAALAAEPEGGVSPPEARRFGEMVRRRVAREPVAYILGRKGFRHLELAIDRRALIPRPETELLVDVAVELGPASILDVGTGSGAVALAVASELPNARVVGADPSEAALDLARENAERLGLADRVSFVAVATGEFDLVVANLPYVRDHEWRTLAPEIRDYEPREALLAGPDGLGPITALLADPPPCASIALEVGAGQAPAVAERVRRAGFDRISMREDLAGIERVVVGLR